MTLAHLCLGTASWSTVGPRYHDRVPPSDDELDRILDVAAAGGIRWLDAARSYGNVWERLTWMRTARFKVIDKVKPDVFLVGGQAPVVLTHLGPENAFRWPRCDRSQKLCGASVYTVDQATAALDAGVQVLQVPWNMSTVVESATLFRLRLDVLVPMPEPGPDGPSWFEVRDHAYADGVLFFGRQPFAGDRITEPSRREVFQWALQTNPRGWCVVGVETAAQVEELLRWREEITA